MDTTEAIRHMLEKAGKSGRQLSRLMGRSPTYVGTTLTNGHRVAAENLAIMARHLGYKLLLKGHGEEIEITPREVGDADSDKRPADQR